MLTFLPQLKRTQNLQASEGEKIDANLVLDNTASMSQIDIAYKSVSNLGILLPFFFGGLCILGKKLLSGSKPSGKKDVLYC